MEVLERDETSIIALVDIEKLHDHEKVKEGHLKDLVEQIEKDNELRYPIIVDKYSYVVLDGHHRFFALKALGCKRVAAQIVDYYHPGIKVESWNPVIKTKEEVEEIFDGIKQAGFTILKANNEKVVKVLVERKQACIGMIVKNSKDEYFVVLSRKKDFKSAMECIQACLKKAGLRKELDYVEEKEAETLLKKREVSMVIIIPKVTKEKVVEMGMSGETFPPKTTRHIIPEKKLYPVSLAILKTSGKIKHITPL